MSANTSPEAVNRYKKKTYSRYVAEIKKDEFTIIEEFRAKEGLSRTEFIKMLVNEKYGTNL